MAAVLTRRMFTPLLGATAGLAAMKLPSVAVAASSGIAETGIPDGVTEPFILWGDGVHDDTDALVAFFQMKWVMPGTSNFRLSGDLSVPVSEGSDERALLRQITLVGGNFKRDKNKVFSAAINTHCGLYGPDIGYLITQVSDKPITHEIRNTWGWYFKEHPDRPLDLKIWRPTKV